MCDADRGAGQGPSLSRGEHACSSAPPLTIRAEASSRQERRTNRISFQCTNCSPRTCRKPLFSTHETPPACSLVLDAPFSPRLTMKSYCALLCLPTALCSACRSKPHQEEQEGDYVLVGPRVVEPAGSGLRVLRAAVRSAQRSSARMARSGREQHTPGCGRHQGVPAGARSGSPEQMQQNLGVSRGRPREEQRSGCAL